MCINGFVLFDSAEYDITVLLGSFLNIVLQIESNRDKGADMELWRFAICKKGHKTGRCSATLVQLSIPYHVCSICKAVVHNYFGMSMNVLAFLVFQVHLFSTIF